MSFDLPALTAAVAAAGHVVRIVVLREAGSVPRGAGTAMLVTADDMQGTIGGGTLEWEAIKTARAMLAEGAVGKTPPTYTTTGTTTGTTRAILPGNTASSKRRMQVLPLGPALGQCCGGSVTLGWELFDANTLPATLPYLRSFNDSRETPPPALTRADPPAGSPPREMHGWVLETAPAPARGLWIWGAGHVGRALVNVMATLPDWQITWADTGADRFPAMIPAGVTAIPATDLPRLAAHAPRDAEHLIVTMSHETDLALCHTLLTRGFAACGLIGSATKWARFTSRLQTLGHCRTEIAKIACPIGDPTLGKHPQAIAVGVAGALLSTQHQTNRGNRAG